MMTLSGCGSLPEADCQVRAGAVTAEGSFDPFGARAMGGAATWVGDQAKCPNFRALTRSPSGSVVCAGEKDWCDAAIQNTPLQVTPQQLREILNGEPEPTAP